MGMRTTLIGVLAVIAIVGLAMVGQADAGSRIVRDGYLKSERQEPGHRAGSGQVDRYQVDHRRAGNGRFRQRRRDAFRHGHRQARGFRHRRGYRGGPGRRHRHGRAGHNSWTAAIQLNLSWLLYR